MTKILVIDEGTSSVRAGVYDETLKHNDFIQTPVALYSPSPEIVEQDANEIWNKTLEVAKSAALNKNIDAIGITNQRETTILWDRSGTPIHNALVWQDRRGADFGEELKSDGREAILNSKTGLLADPYFSAFKLKYLFENIEGLRARALNGEILFGTIDAWLIYKLTGGKSHVTDATNASRTALFNIQTGAWDDELLEIFNIPKAILPKVLDSNAHFGDCDLFGKTIPIMGVLGDQQAALMGQDCFDYGDAKITFGTGAFLMVMLKDRPKTSNNKMLLTIASKINGKTNYAMEGAILNAGTAIAWLRDELGIIKSASETEEIANTLIDNSGVYLVPAFTGLGAPFWDADARASITGLGRKTGRAHIIRAALEASAYQTYDILEAIKKDDIAINTLKIDGGMAKNNFFAQFLADICDIKIQRPEDLEMTAMGAAKIALLGLKTNAGTNPNKVFEPKLEKSIRAKFINGWKKAIESVLKAK